MKKISLLLFVCAAMFTSAMAQDGTPSWPDAYDKAKTGFDWGEFMDPDLTAIAAAPTAEIKVISGLYDLALPLPGEDPADFMKVWDKIPGDAFPLDQIREIGRASCRERV